MAGTPTDADGAPDRGWRLRNGTRVVIRAPEDADEPALAAFHRDLSDRSLYLRYFSLTRIQPRVDDIRRSSNVSHVGRISLAAEVTLSPGVWAIVAIGALVPVGDGSSAEMALLVADAYQGHGLGAELLRRLIAVAKRQGIRTVAGEMLAENERMCAMALHFGFTLFASPDDARLIRAELTL